MATRAILALALLLPATVHADDMLRWRDARGRLHYSNDTERTPPGAKPIVTTLGEIGGAPIGPPVEPALAEGRTPAPREAGFRTAQTGCVRRLAPSLLSNRTVVDLDRPDWYWVDGACGRQHDLEAWLRQAQTTLELRAIGF